MIEDYKRFNKIATALNSTFGTSGPGEAGLTLQSVKLILADETVLTAKYVSSVTFSRNERIETLMKKFRDEAIERVRAALKAAQANFEKQNPDDKGIKFTVDTKNFVENVDYVNVSSPIHRAFYKFSCSVKVS